MHPTAIKNHLSASVLIAINCLFAFKYLSRVTDLAAIAVLVLAFGQFLFYYYLSNKTLVKKCYNPALLLLLILILCLVVLANLKIPLESLNVDRHSVISSFIEALFNGEYPYYAKSHMGNPPGPMPFYFLLAYPFYALGLLSALSAVGYFCFAFILKSKSKHRHGIFLIFLLLSSFPMLWEILSRSNIFSYSSFIVFALLIFSKFRSFTLIQGVTIGILLGLLLSTRSIYILAYVIFFIPELIPNINKKILPVLVPAILSFALTFLPFILFYKDDFFTMNPFVIQSGFLIPSSFTILFIFLAFIFSFFVKGLSDKFFYSGLSLCLSILIYAVYHIIHFGLTEAFINSKVDISYFIFCMPFLMMSMVLNENKEINPLT